MTDMLAWFFGWILTLMWIDYTLFKGAVIPTVFKALFGLAGIVAAVWWTKKETKKETEKDPEYQEFLRQKEITETYYNTLQKLKEQNQ